jgi:hypothetical protein
MFRNFIYDKNFVMKKFSYNFKILSLFFVLVFCVSMLSGCASGAVNYYLSSFPSKLVYEVGEKVDFSGLKVESINSDGTNNMIALKEEYFSDVDTSTAGVKKVKITNGKLSTAFNIYVANIVVTDSDNLKEKLAAAKDGDIVYLKAGNYVPKNSGDTSYKDIVVDKSLIIVGDGKDKTKFSGNFVIGATGSSENFEAIENFADVKIMNIGFSLESKIVDGFVNYSGPYGKTDTNGALRIFDTQNLLVYGCSFSGFAYGILGDDVSGLTVKNSIFKNIFMDIATNVVVVENGTQSSVGCVELSFGKKGNAGVIVSNNTFNRTALMNGKTVYYDEESKTFATSTSEQLFVNGYVNNSAIITLKSSAEDDLLVDGIILCSNNYGQSLVNIRLNTRTDNNIDQNGVLITETY